jgi:hypothetical protein
MWWLVYSTKEGVCFILQRGGFLSCARSAAEASGLGTGQFQEGHQIAPELALKIPQEMTGKRLSPEQASELLEFLLIGDAKE